MFHLNFLERQLVLQEQKDNNETKTNAQQKYL